MHIMMIGTILSLLHGDDGTAKYLLDRTGIQYKLLTQEDIIDILRAKNKNRKKLTRLFSLKHTSTPVSVSTSVTTERNEYDEQSDVDEDEDQESDNDDDESEVRIDDIEIPTVFITDDDMPLGEMVRSLTNTTLPVKKSCYFIIINLIMSDNKLIS